MRLIVITFTLLLPLMVLSCGGDKAETESSASATADHQTTNQPSSMKPMGQSEGDSKGNIAFQAYDIEGTLRRSSEWIGKQPVIINIWGTWCPPCRKEIPDMVRFYNEYSKKGVEILGIAVRDTPQKVRNYANQQDMDWVMLLGDRNTVSTMGNVTAVPTTIVLDEEGREVERWTGPRSYEQFKEAAEKLL
jgi:thiol-disulfide isomerase/thioredoxin